ncbi:MAG: hypothetical protein KFB93_05360 [Simkaniaceae bacterium]|nr:MAG: hypothetical protein KFB93_05360 [Simkaniaceae bacterium]
MKSFLTKFGIILLVLASLAGVERLSHFLTDGFSYSNITSTLPYHQEWDTPIAESDQAEAKKALAQPYTYLESGSQSYVFISEDNKYVLKFFKHKRWRLSPFLELLPLPEKLNAKRLRWKQKKKETVYSTFGSCITSYQEFKEETGVLFVHLNKSSLNQLITIKDRIGFKHRIELSDVEFILQRKAIPTDKYLLSLKMEGETKEAEKALSLLLAFTVKRAEKGYSDKDPHLIRNFGFIDGKAVEIDIGGFHHDPKKDLVYFHTHEMRRIKRKLLPWLEENYPELTTHAEKELAKLID